MPVDCMNQSVNHIWTLKVQTHTLAGRGHVHTVLRMRHICRFPLRKMLCKLRRPYVEVILTKNTDQSGPESAKFEWSGQLITDYCPIN